MLCKTNGCDSDICVQCISQSGHVNNGDDKDGKEGEEQSAESEKKEKCEKKDMAFFINESEPSTKDKYSKRNQRLWKILLDNEEAKSKS